MKSWQIYIVTLVISLSALLVFYGMSAVSMEHMAGELSPPLTATLTDERLDLLFFGEDFYIDLAFLEGVELASERAEQILEFLNLPTPTNLEDIPTRMIELNDELRPYRERVVELVSEIF